MVCKTRPGVSSELSKSPGSSSSSSSTYGRSRGTDDLPIGRRRQIRCHRRTYDIAAHKPFGRKFERSVWNECQTGGLYKQAPRCMIPCRSVQVGTGEHLVAIGPRLPRRTRLALAIEEGHSGSRSISNHSNMRQKIP